MAIVELICLGVRKVTARKKRSERHSQAEIPRRTTASAAGENAQRNIIFDSDSSDDDDVVERRPHDDDSSFEIANEMWCGSMIEMTTNRGSQSLAESTVTSQPVPNFIPLGPFAGSEESDWHYDICFSCSPALCVRCECCSKTNVCHCGFPWIQAFIGCCNNIPLAHLSTKLEAAGVSLRIGFYGIVYVHFALVIFQFIIFRKFDIRVPVSVYSYFAFLVTFYLRGKMRNELNIRGNVVEDFLCSIFCNGCVIMQMFGQAFKSPPGCTLNDMDGAVE